MNLEDMLRVYSAAITAHPTHHSHERDLLIESMYDHLKSDDMAGGERALHRLVTEYAHNAELALMLPNIFMTTLPRILASGSVMFRHKDGTAFCYGHKLATSEYSFLYVERLMQAVREKYDDKHESVVFESLKQIWLILYDLLPPLGRACVRDELKQNSEMIQFLPDDMNNVVAFPRH